MSDNNNGLTSGSLLTTLLLVLFIGLKLCDKIQWSWWWVLSPIWTPLGLVLVIWVVAVILIAWKGNK